METIKLFLEGSAVWGFVLSTLAYGLGTLIYKKTKLAICTPLLLATIFVIAFLRLAAIPYDAYQSSSSLISYLLMPATVSLAVPLYQKWDLLKANIVSICLGIMTGVLASLGSILLLAKAFHLSREHYVSLLPKSITTAIAIDVSAEFGGVVSLTTTIILFTGITGYLIAEIVCRLFHINSPIARGIAIGTSAHAMGTAKALEMGETEGAMSGLAIAVAGVLTAVIVPFFVPLL